MSNLAQDLARALQSLEYEAARKEAEEALKRAEQERMQFERQLQQLQKKESLGRMAGAIAHLFNNQLGVVSESSCGAAFFRKILDPRARVFPETTVTG